MKGIKRILCGASAVLISPLIATAAVNLAPDADDLILLSQQSLFEKEKVDGFGNGNLLLYKPTEDIVDSAETAESSDSVAGEQIIVPEITTLSTEEDSPVTTLEIGNESGENEAAEIIDEIGEKVVVTTDVETLEALPETAPESSAVENDPLLISQNISDETEDLSVFNGVSGNIEKLTITSNQGANFINLTSGAQVRNDTNLSNEFVEAQTLLPTGVSIDFNSSEPQVLIIHTHTSESYEISDKDFYDANYTCRTVDSQKSVVAVGAAIAEELASAGIFTLHDGTVHDSPYYTGAYERSAATIGRILTQYPSIKVILDIHRDAIEEYDGTRVGVVSDVDGTEAAQVMIIAAADDGTYDVPNFLENFRFACALQNQMESSYPGITRPILFQYCQYNQQFTTGSLLIEVGSHGNTLSEAKYTGKLIGKSLVELLKNS